MSSESDGHWSGGESSQQGAQMSDYPQPGQYPYLEDLFHQSHPAQHTFQQQPPKHSFQQQQAQAYQQVPQGAPQQMPPQTTFYQQQPHIHPQQQQDFPLTNTSKVSQQHSFQDAPFQASQARFDPHLMSQFNDAELGLTQDNNYQSQLHPSSSFAGLEMNGNAGPSAATHNQGAIVQSSSMPNVQQQQPFANLNSWTYTNPLHPTASSSSSHENPYDFFNNQFPTDLVPLGINGLASGAGTGHEDGGMSQPHSFGESSGSLQRDKKPAALDFNHLHHARHLSQPAYLSADPKLSQHLTQSGSQQNSLAFPSAAANWHTHSGQLPHHQGTELQHRSISADLLSPVQSDQAMASTSFRGAGQISNPSAFQLHHQSSFDRLTPTSSVHSAHSSNRPDQIQFGMPTNSSDGHSSQPAFQYIPPHKQLTFDDANSASWFESPALSDVSAFASNPYTSHSPRKISTPQRIQNSRDGSVMAAPPLPAGLPTTPNQVENESTDYRLSTALANNAHISSITPTKAKPRPRQKSQQKQPGQQQVVPSQSQSQSLENGISTLQMTEEQKDSGYGQQIMRMEPLDFNNANTRDQGEEGSDRGTIRRYRPKIRPNIFQQTSSSSLSKDEPSGHLQDCTSFMGEVLSEYLASPSRLGMGERSVLIMTSKVAQKSYGNEKRFLCPPPMVLLVGSSWWSSCQDSGRGQDEFRPTLLTPPRLNIAMSGEAGVADSQLEWASHSGRLIDVENPSCEMAISGRSIGKQLFINDADEKRRHCEALASISMPGRSLTDRRHLGIFSSKPIKVISKPSKKRQSNRTSDFSVNHGSTISLFHRLRSQTVSTRYLCVSGAPTWFKGSDGISFLNSDVNTHIPNQAEPSSCFVAKMTSWDPFIIYLVDPHMEAPSTGANSGKPPPVPGYPPPPSNILPISAGIQGKPICYNQAVVLQCLNTAVVSPVMIIRKVERNTIVVGGGQSYNSSGALHMGGGGGGSRMDPTEEALGDPVSQLHKVAFETVEDPNAHVPIAENREISTPGHSGPFLGCLNEEVGLNKPLGPRQWNVNGFSGPSTPTTPSTPSMIPMTSSSSSRPSSAKASGTNSDPFDVTSRIMMDASMGIDFGSTSSGVFASGSNHLTRQQQQQYLHGDMSYDHSLGNSPGVSSDEGSGNKRARRLSSSIAMSNKDRTGSSSSLSSLTSANKNRRRGQSLSMLSMQKTASATPTQQNQYPQSQSQSHQPIYDDQWNNNTLPQSMQSSFSFTGGSNTSTTDGNNNLALRRSSSFAHSISNSEASSSTNFGGIPPGSLWTVEVHDSDIWTIVGVDIARHTFYIPTKLVGGIRSPIDEVDQNIAHLINVPAPAMPITPIPVILNVQLPASLTEEKVKGKHSSISSGSGNKGSLPALTRPSEGFLTLTGENFSHDLFVYFGDWNSQRVTFESGSILYCEPPPNRDEYGYPRGRVAIVLVRRDGVVFPSQFTYVC